MIRSPLEKDAEALKDAIEESIKDLKPWMPWADHIPTLVEARENCSKAAQDFQDGKDHRLHIFLKESSLFLGGSGLHNIDWSVPLLSMTTYFKICHLSGKSLGANRLLDIAL